jgi:hypothetical protein
MALARPFRLVGETASTSNEVGIVESYPLALGGNQLRMTDMAGGQSRNLSPPVLTKSPTKRYPPITPVRSPFKLR